MAAASSNRWWAGLGTNQRRSVKMGPVVQPPLTPLGHILLLHGHGGSPLTMEGAATVLRGATGATVSVPQAPFATSEGWAWWEDSADGPPRGLVASLRHEYRQVGPIDAVIGFSQGGALALAWDDVPRIACIGGFLATPPPAHGPAVFVAHGRADTVVDPDHGDFAARRCRKAGCAVTEEHHDGGHEWPPSVTEALLRWLGAD